MSTIWQRRRKAAREAGRQAAQGGPDLREHFAGLHALESYDEGYQQEIRDNQERADFEESIAPLQQINWQADALSSRSDNGEVREIADMLRDLTNYLMEKERG